MRFVSFVLIGAIAGTVACDDDGGVEGPGGNLGFNAPAAMPTANTEVGGVWTEIGPADFSCLNTPTSEVPLVADTAISGVTNDFQTSDEVDNVDLAVFEDVFEFESGTPLVETTSDADAEFSLTLPAGTGRVAFRMTDPEAMPRFLDTYVVNQYYDGDNDEVELSSVSFATASALPAFIGVKRTPGLGILAGAIRDCNDDEVSGVVATVTSNSCVGLPDCVPEHLPGAATYYFSAGPTSLPVRLTQQPDTAKDGLFVVLELPVASNSYLQVWGYTDASQIETGDMQLIAEIPSPVLPDSVITGSMVPLRTE